MKVLDAGAFVESSFLKGVTAPGVAKETRVPPDIEIRIPKKESLAAVETAAGKSGDLDVLSRADKEVLALAYELKAILVTNDFAVQNVASRMGLSWEPTEKGIKEEIKWEWFCPACWKKSRGKGACEFCGTLTKRRPKSRRMKTL